MVANEPCDQQVPSDALMTLCFRFSESFENLCTLASGTDCRLARSVQKLEAGAYLLP